MKRTALIKKLHEIGPVEVVREGGSHTIYSVGGVKVSIPRHHEIGEGLAAKIIRQAQKGKDDG
ncbi:MAG TPA: type II toxin-antitoxin system HicA family toxin [Acidimicrobiales bacterium]